MSAKLTITIPEWLDKICAWPVLLYRRRKYGYSYRKISLERGRFTIVDPQDYYRLGNFKWYINGNGVRFYVFRNVITGPGRTRMLSMHRDIMNSPKGLLVDHRNGDTFDNTRANLRLATHSQNSCNMHAKRKGCSSKYRGVSFDKKRKFWNTQVALHGKMVYFGRFKSEIDAARAYDKAAREYHKEFACLNFPEENLTVR